jgi:HEAT repeat protein
VKQWKLFTALIVVVCLGVAVIAFIAMAGQETTPKITALYDRLIQPSETNAAAPEILELATNDSMARDFLARKLPSLIVDRLPPLDARTASPVWLNAVRLAGQLKIVEAVPALTQSLSRRELCGAYDIDLADSCSVITFARMARLGFDIVGRALADIGDPSVPAVAGILSNGDLPARKRATWILINIDSPAAHKAMRDHLPSEGNPIVKEMIERVLEAR